MFRRHLGCLTLYAAVILFTALGCSRDTSYPSRPITIICPWAAGGGTDRVSRQIAMHLEQELAVPVNVVNATGGKGVTGHNRGMTARPDGYTITMITFELSTMHWMDLTELTYRDCIPLVGVNEDYAALLVRQDAVWQTLPELEAAIRENPGELTASGTAVGGAWHLALAGWLNAGGLNANDVVWVPSEGSNPSLQQLISGGIDLVCCSLPEARTLLEAGEIRGLGVMSRERVAGFEDVASFREQGNDWSLGGWRGLSVPLGTPEPIVERLVETLRKIAKEETGPDSFQSFMQSQKFDSTFRGPEEFTAFLAETDRKLGDLLTSPEMQSLSQDSFDPMAYPYALLAGLAACLAGVWFLARHQSDTPETDTDGRPTLRIDNFVTVLAGIVLYILLAEILGFVITAFLVLVVVLLKFGTRPLPACLIALAIVPSSYLVFAYVLRVMLPRGLLG